VTKIEEKNILYSIDFYLSDTNRLSKSRLRILTSFLPIFCKIRMC